MYAELVVSLVVMMVIFALITVLSDKYLFPMLDRREARKEAIKEQALKDDAEV